MVRYPTETLTVRESQLMDILWNRGPSTADAVRKELSERLHDSTVRTLLRILIRKGCVRTRDGQPVIYKALVERSHVQSKATRNLLARFFGGSVEDLVMRLVEDEQLSPDQLERIRKSLKKPRRKRRSNMNPEAVAWLTLKATGLLVMVFVLDAVLERHWALATAAALRTRYWRRYCSCRSRVSCCRH